MNRFEKIQINPEEEENKSGLTLEALRNKPIYKKVRKFMVYLSISAALSAGMEGAAKYVEAREKDKQEQVEKKEAESMSIEQIAKLQDQKEYIQREIGPHILSHLLSSHLEERDREAKDLEINGSEKVGVEAATFRALWSEGDTYPRGWIDDDIDEVDIVDDDLLENKDVVYRKENQELAGVADHLNRMQLVVIDVPDKKDKLETLDWTFSHESGHLNDWAKDRNAKLYERVDLLARVHQRMTAPDRFRDPLGDSYGDMKMIKNEEKRQFCLTKEYWATLCEYYFTFPEILRNEAPADFDLVDEWVKREDPNFNPLKAANRRSEIISQAVQE